MEESHNYLLECFKGSYDELKFRIKHRDAWLKTHFIFQLALCALANGLSLNFVSSDQAIPSLLSLTLPSSLVVLIFYLIEENTISSLSRYLAGLSRIEADLTKGVVINNFDSLEVATKFFKNTQKMRVTGQIFSFLLIPVFLFFAPLRNFIDIGLIDFSIGAVSGAIIIILMAKAHVNRQHDIDSRLIDSESNNSKQPTADASAD